MENPASLCSQDGLNLVVPHFLRVKSSEILVERVSGRAEGDDEPTKDDRHGPSQVERFPRVKLRVELGLLHLGVERAVVLVQAQLVVQGSRHQAAVHLISTKFDVGEESPGQLAVCT